MLTVGPAGEVAGPELPPPPGFPPPFPTATLRSPPGPWPPSPTSGAPPGTPPGDPSTVPAGPTENAPESWPAGIEARSLKGIGFTLRDRISGPPPVFWASPAGPEPGVLPDPLAEDASAAAGLALCGAEAGAGGAAGRTGGAGAACWTGCTGLMTGGGGSGTSRWAEARLGKCSGNASVGGGGGGCAATFTDVGTTGVNTGLGGGGGGGGGILAFCGAGAGGLGGAGAGVAFLGGAGANAGPPEMKSGTNTSLGSLSFGGAGVFSVTRKLSGLGGLEMIVMRESNRVAPKRGRAPGFAPRPGAFPAPGGWSAGRYGGSVKCRNSYTTMGRWVGLIREVPRNSKKRAANGML